MDKSALSSNERVETEEEDTRELQLAVEAQGRYMSFLSHDLRGSLNGLVLMVEVLKREIEGKSETPEAVLSDLAMMKRALVDTVAMMERHVLADRLRRGRAPMNHQPVELSDLVQEVIAKAQTTARAKADIAMDVPAEAVVHTDRELLRMALQELVDNLARHCGQCRATISAKKSGAMWTIEISDDGPGLAQDRLEQWLDPIKRGQIKDRGIGLTLAQQIAQSLGGKLEGTLAEGKGLTLRLSLRDQELGKPN
jgi:two-component system sensor histidine kinase VanS